MNNDSEGDQEKRISFDDVNDDDDKMKTMRKLYNLSLSLQDYSSIQTGVSLVLLSPPKSSSPPSPSEKQNSAQKKKKKKKK